ncbi:MAG: carboxypeptidase M32 [Nanoarchaeota archaeon]
MKSLEFIKKEQKEISLLLQISSVLDWDQKTYMPSGSSKEKSEQRSYLSKKIHNKLTSDKLFEEVKKLKRKRKELEEKNKIIIDRLYKDIIKARKVPEELIEKISKATSKGFDKWQEAKRKNDFEIFKPSLKKIVKLKRKEAKALDLDGHIYNSLLDQFEEGMTVEKLDPIFEELKEGIIELKDKINNSNDVNNMNNKDISNKDKIDTVEKIINLLNLPNSRFRFDISEHPFTTYLNSNDIRITVNLDEEFEEVIFSTLHESGHAIHSLNLPKEDQYNVLYDSPSLGIAESQSRLWENLIGKNKNFWKNNFSIINDKIDMSLEEWIKSINSVKPNKIRVKSDEVHYCLHIILRYELEKGLIEGSIEVEDLPELWNKKMEEYLGLKPEDDREGILQDVHWSEGFFGYFPSYALGNIYASQFYNKLSNEVDISKLDKKKIKEIKKWLGKNIHKHERKILAEDLIKKVSGEELSPEIFIDYLNNKYSKI